MQTSSCAIRSPEHGQKLFGRTHGASGNGHPAQLTLNPETTDREDRMNSRLPDDGDNVQVRLREGEWQDAIYRGDDFVDRYGLPLAFDKIQEWRPAPPSRMN